MDLPATSSHVTPSPGAILLRRAGLIWYLTAAIGQLAFIAFISGYYGRRTVTGDYPGWNDKPIIKGYVEGDIAGNIMFAAHVLMAAIITLGGLIQLVPAIRSRFPALHRWNGRLFLVTAIFMAIGGLWLIWGRGTYLSVAQGIPLSFDSLLILLFGAMAWRLAAARQIDAHRHWAMRTFMVVNGVWFLRVAMMAWYILTGGAGLTRTMSGPVDLALQFGCYLVPLAILELYFVAQRSQSPPLKRTVSILVLLATAIMAVGIFGTIAFMWLPYM